MPLVNLGMALIFTARSEFQPCALLKIYGHLCCFCVWIIFQSNQKTKKKHIQQICKITTSCNNFLLHILLLLPFDSNTAFLWAEIMFKVKLTRRQLFCNFFSDIFLGGWVLYGINHNFRKSTFMINLKVQRHFLDLGYNTYY